MGQITFGRGFFGVVALSAAMSVTAESAQAARILRSRPPDLEVRQGELAPASASATLARIGYNPEASNQGRRFVTTYQLPLLDPGESITGANLAVNLISLAPGGDGNFNVDVVALGRRVNSNVIREDYSAAVGPDLVNHPTYAETFLVDNIIPDNPTFDTVNGTDFNSDAAGDTALLNYINAIYTADPTLSGGAFIVLRFQQDGGTAPGVGGQGIGYNVRTGDVANDANKPTITLDTIPEPASMGLLAAAGALAFRRRARRA